jgi:hypothetical protein
MEEKLLASLAGRKKANASRLLRRKESGGKRAAATKVDVEIRQGHKDASQKPADDVTISVILDSDHSVIVNGQACCGQGKVTEKKGSESVDLWL